MKWLLLSTILTSCTPYYTAVVISKGTFMGQLEMETQVSEGFNKNMSEHEIMLSRGIYRIYDCGNKKWEWINQNTYPTQV